MTGLAIIQLLCFYQMFLIISLEVEVKETHLNLFFAIPNNSQRSYMSCILQTGTEFAYASQIYRKRYNMYNLAFSLNVGPVF
ncbi:hypothetical protein EDC96DRAFT_494018 [Choanephora cucurbitarum]|nr:hypothetical protein EDC96DRAFT_520528 [Choanephora cucurbitarum]KAI8378231.1 hypothetical protein EDC96DRAFT_494018 [Choanephora cucurbitarum]